MYALSTGIRSNSDETIGVDDCGFVIRTYVVREAVGFVRRSVRSPGRCVAGDWERAGIEIDMRREAECSLLCQGSDYLSVRLAEKAETR